MPAGLGWFLGAARRFMEVGAHDVVDTVRRLVRLARRPRGRSGLAGGGGGGVAGAGSHGVRSEGLGETEFGLQFSVSRTVDRVFYDKWDHICCPWDPPSPIRLFRCTIENKLMRTCLTRKLS
jgi:hypothetical protein